jgi:hypothetical protein
MIYLLLLLGLNGKVTLIINFIKGKFQKKIDFIFIKININN